MKYCSKCGKQLTDEALFCYACGKAVDGNLTGSTIQANTAKDIKSSKNLKIILISFLTLILLGGVVWVWQNYEIENRAIKHNTEIDENNKQPQIKSKPKDKINLAGGLRSTFSIYGENVSQADIDNMIRILKNRSKRLGLIETEVYQDGSDRIIIDIGKKNSDPEIAVHILTQQTKLEFMDETGKIFLTGKNLKCAEATVESGNSIVNLEFDKEGGKIFAAATAANIGKPIAIVLDGKTISAPIIEEAITDGHAQIAGSFTNKESQDLAILLNAGALPVNLNMISKHVIQ